MIFGLAGAHRTGKSTLAKAIAEGMGIHYFEASFGAFAQELGFNAVAADLTPEGRVEMQFKVLDLFLDKLQTAPRPLIADRTPLDMVGYMLGEVTMHSDPKLATRITEYVGSCVDATETFFDTVIICRPLPIYVSEPGKPPMNRAYQMAVQCIIEGAGELADVENHQVLMTDDHDARLLFCVEELSKRIDAINADHAEAMASGKLH